MYNYVPESTHSSYQFAKETRDVNILWFAPREPIPVPDNQFEPHVAAQHNEVNLPIANCDMAAVRVATRVTTEKPAARKLIVKHPRSTTITDTELVNVNVKKPRNKKNQGKENRVEVDEDDEILAKGQIWSSDDKTTPFEWLLGADSTVFNIHKTNPD